MSIIFNVVLVLACGFFDRMRGDPRDIINRTVEKFLYGTAAGLLCVGLGNIYVLIAFAVLFSVGSSPSWGTPLGAVLGGSKMDESRLHWWQFGPLKKSALLSLAFRGAMWGACLLPLLYWDKSVVMAIPVIAIAMPLSAKCGYWLRHRIDDIWAFHEIIRGVMIGGIFAVF